MAHVVTASDIELNVGTSIGNVIYDPATLPTR